MNGRHLVQKQIVTSIAVGLNIDWNTAQFTRNCVCSCLCAVRHANNGLFKVGDGGTAYD